MPTVAEVWPRFIEHLRAERNAPNTVSAYTGADLDNTMRAVAPLAGVPSLGPHALRHSFASFLLAAGASLPAVSRLLGHSSVAVTASTYAHVLPHAERGAVDKLEALTRGVAPVTDLAQERARRKKTE